MKRGSKEGLLNTPYRSYSLKTFIPATVACTMHDYCFIVLLCHYLYKASSGRDIQFYWVMTVNRQAYICL